MELLYSVEWRIMYSGNDFFINTRPSHLFFKAAIPGAVGMIASNIYFSLEMLLIGRLIGQEAFAAGNLALPLILINFALADMIAVGSAVRIAIRLGEGRKMEANQVFTTAILTAIILSALSSLVLILGAPWFFSMMGASGNLLEEAVLYLRVYSVFTPVTCLVFVFDNYLRICGRVRFSMVMNIVMSVLCLFFEFLFLYVFDRGIGYAALGTSLGMTISCIMCAFPFIRGRLSLRFVRVRPSASLLADLFAQGLANFLSNISGKITSILMNSLLLMWGGDLAVSVYGVFMNIDGIVVPGMYGIFDSLQPAIGYNWGAERKDRVRRIALYCVIAIAILCLASTILLEIFPSQVFAMFVESDEAGMVLARHAISIMALVYLVRWISYACQSFSSAIGYNRQATVISLCNALVFPLLMMLVLYPLELEGIWLVTPAAGLLTGIVAILIFLFSIRKALRLPH